MKFWTIPLRHSSFTRLNLSNGIRFGGFGEEKIETVIVVEEHELCEEDDKIPEKMRFDPVPPGFCSKRCFPLGIGESDAATSFNPTTPFLAWLNYLQNCHFIHI